MSDTRRAQPAFSMSAPCVSVRNRVRRERIMGLRKKTKAKEHTMTYAIARGLLASNCLVAMQRALPGGPRDNEATSTTYTIDWLPDWRPKETRHTTSTYRIA